MELGYWLSGEEHAAPAQVRYAQMAEAIGFRWVMVSDHFHPWIDRQGQSPFVWSVLGGIAATTRSLHVATGVTCPLFRIHPAILAQAAATVATMFEGRFALGVGTGENLNEHVLGHHWPPYPVRREMLHEAVDVMRLLWGGGLRSHRGKYYTVEHARLYSLPEHSIPVYVAAEGPLSGKLAGRIGDGLIASARNKEVLAAFAQGGGEGKPRHGWVTMCWGRSKQEAVRTVHERWPSILLDGRLARDLPLPQHFESAARFVTEEMIAKAVLCGPIPSLTSRGSRNTGRPVSPRYTSIN
jgi:G6PDH family F420-dependent oxidoreductase